MAAKTPDKNVRQKQALIRIVIMAAILICVNVLASYFHTGLDLTHEKRFTLSEPTKKLLRNMREVAVIDIYLKGKFPAELQRMQEAVRERLRSFKDFAGNKIIYRFIDPLEGKSEAEQKQIVHDLGQKGISYMPLRKKDDDEEGYSMKICFPYALVQYNGKEMPVLLLENPPGKTPAEKISYAEANLEYKFANALNQMGRRDKARIAYVMGNGEEYGVPTIDMLSTLPGAYDLDTVDLAHSLHISPAYDAIIVYEPTTPFTGPDKLKIDQYVMRGGHVLWVVNTMKASLDSLVNSPQFISTEYGLNLDDILFKYGVRINNDLIEDRQNIPLPRMMNGSTPELHEWVYFPKLNPTADHPIVKNMDFIMTGFSNSIDTIKNSIKKTILLQSSKYSRTAGTPVRVSLSMMSYPLKNEMFNKPYQPVAVLLEGKFHSVYQNILAPEYLRLLDSLKEPFKPVCDSNNSMIVVSAGQIFSNGYTTKDGVLPMGWYKYTSEYYANKDFLLNCMEYLTDHSGILEARSKEVKLRLLDTGRAKDEKTTWQVVNVGIPITLVLVFASAYFFFRKRRYEVKQTPSKPTA
jgi:ABC-2 type transport system permease protein